MEASSNVTKTVQLTLTESEARWVQAVMQNPMCEDESVEDAVNRHKLFHALKQALSQQ